MRRTGISRGFAAAVLAGALAMVMSAGAASAQERDVDQLLNDCIYAPNAEQTGSVLNACTILIDEDILEDLLEYGDISETNAAAVYINRSQALSGAERFEPALADAQEGRRRAPEQPVAHYAEALALMGLNRNDEALAAFNAYLRQEPTDAMALYRRGVLHRFAGRNEQALRDQDAVLAQHPNDPDALAERARLRQALGNLNGALSDLDAVVRQAPTDVMLGLRSSVNLDLRNFDQAIADADRAAALVPGNAEYENQRCWSRAVANRDLTVARQACDQALRLQPGAAHILDSRGLVRLRQGEDGAYDDFDAALRAEPRMAASLFGRGLAMLRMGSRADGQRDVDAALAIEPGIGREYAQMGLPWPEVSASDQAATIEGCLRPGQGVPGMIVVAHCSTLIEEGRLTARGDLRDAHVSRGLARAISSDLDGALADAQAAAGMGAQDGAELIRARVALGQRQFADALTQFNAYLRKHPNDARALHWRALTYFSTQRRPEGRADLDAAIRADPAYVDARVLRAADRSAQRNWTGVVEDMDASIALVSDQGSLYMTRSSAHLGLNNHAEAIRDADLAWTRGVQSWTAANQRCWTRAVANRDLQTARTACDESIVLRSGYANLDSRGLVGLRQGRNQDAWNDYDAAVRDQPNEASPLYGRGLAALRLGRMAEGYADLAAASTKEANIAADFEAMGLRP